MSKISNLGKNNKNLIKILDKYDDELVNAEAIIKLDGKTLEEALREHATWELYYNQRFAELKILLEHFDNEIQVIRGKLCKKYIENYSRVTSDRMIEKFVTSEDEYRIMHGLFLEVREVYEKYNAVIETFKSKGFILGNITRARVASVHGDII